MNFKRVVAEREAEFRQIEPLDLTRVRSVDDLVRAMAHTAFTARQLGEAADVLEAMAQDEECFVVMTLAGSMMVARQSLIIAELIDRGIVNAIVSNGTLITQGLAEVTGRNHYRVHDGSQSEENLDDVREVMAQILARWDANEVMCSYKLSHVIGQHLAEHGEGRGILRSAYLKGVPVFVPAFTDSGLGLDVALNNRLRESTGHHKVRFDPFEDLEHFSATLLRQERLGIFSIGGGVPSTWAQQFGAFIELRHRRMGENVPLKRYHYGLRICSEREANAWGRFAPSSSSENGRFGEVFVDATVGLPMIVAAVLERLGKSKGHVKPKRATVMPAKSKKKARRR